MADLGPGDRLDQFEVIDVLAKSGMATLYRARDDATGATVVLKVPHLEYASDIVFNERFRREDDIGRRLSHPGIVKTLTPASKSRLYLPMEYVAGESLRARLGREKRLPVAEAVRIAIALADTLEYLHEHSVVHRDIKPENVILLPDGSPKLLDFGIALDSTQRRMEWPGLSQTVGTPDYMAPEQQHGRSGDARTDLYALGVMLYEMLTGQVPQRNRDGTVVPPRALRPSIPIPLEQVVLQCLSADPQRRPERALELRDALAHPSSVVIPVAGQRAVDDGMGRGVLLAIAAGGMLLAAIVLFLLARTGGGR
jgi:serine/threonine-protein kinase